MKLRKGVIRQHDERDCGPACLAMIAKRFGAEHSVARIRELAGTDQEGTTLLGLAEAAEKLGFDVIGCEAEFEALAEVPLPAIAHWQGNHFVVIERIGAGKVSLADPAEGVRKLSIDEFRRGWTGLLLLVRAKSGQTVSPNRSAGRLSRFASLLKPRWKTVAETIVCSLILAGLALTGPIVVQLLTDHVLVQRNVHTLNWLMLAMMGILVFTTLFAILRRYLLAHLGRWLDIKLMQTYYNHVMELPSRFFTNRKVGEIISRFNDASKIRQMLGGTAIMSVVDVLMTIAALTLMFVYHWKLALLSAAFLPFFAVSYMAFNPMLRRRTREVMELAADTQSHLVESIGGALGVKCAAATPQICWKADRRLGRLIQRSFKLDMLDNGIESLAAIVSGLGTVMVLWYGAYSVINQSLTIGQLIAFYSLVGMLLSPVERLIGLNRELQDALVAADRLTEILDIPTENTEDKSVLTDVRLGGDIHVDSVRFHFPGRLDLFEGLKCQIPAGKTTVIVGPSGSGKSTLCQMFNRLHTPDSGRITIGGIDISHVALSTLRRRVAYVSPEPFIFAGTVRDNIQLGLPEASFEAVVRAANVARAHEFIEQLPQDYDTQLSEGGANLSTGQRLRLVVARSVLAEPDVLILDETSSLLDPVTEGELFESLRASIPRLTLIVVTHRQTARRWVHHVIRIGGAETESGGAEPIARDGGNGRLLAATTRPEEKRPCPMTL